MPISPPNLRSPIQSSTLKHQSHQNLNTQKRLCDFCGESTALLYCRADSAKLCLACDRQVHSTNPLFTKHTRFQLCDSCDSSPASKLCFTERTVLCQNCDFELHNLHLCSTHDRRPLEGFSGCPSVSELSGFVGVEDLDYKALSFNAESEGFGGILLSDLDGNDSVLENDGFSDLLVWDTPSIVSIDELIASTGKSHNFQANVVSPLPKDKNLCCGLHKQEILHQLRELAKSEPELKQGSDHLARNQNVADESEKELMLNMFGAYQQHDEEHLTFQGHEANSHAGEALNDIFLSSVFSGSNKEEGGLNSDGHSSLYSTMDPPTNGWNSQNPIGDGSLAFPPKVATHEFSSAERDSALSRYKEKKRTRRYEKHIRYESRKVQAESRTRIKGRFAKVGRYVNQGMTGTL